MIRNFFFSVFLILVACNSFAQNGLNFISKTDKSTSVRFKLINNLIVIPLEINGKELSFILDTGVNKTILFSQREVDSIGLNNIKQVTLQGLGNGKPVNALLSEENVFKLNGLASKEEAVYVILKDEFNFAAKMGTTIHGIIGYAALKNVILKINYRTKRLDFYNPARYTYRKCKKCEVFPIQFYRKKPYIDIAIQLDTIGNKKIPVTMLVDSGGSDAIWLFENTEAAIVTPKRYFEDILGEGLSGTVFGKRSRLPSVSLGSFDIKLPTVSFLDSVSSPNTSASISRNGSIGAGLLKRFHVWVDYPNSKITLKKNSHFKARFNYNMSGLTIIYNGQQLVKESYSEAARDSYNTKVDNNNSITWVEKYKFIFKNSYVINRVLPNSPAGKVGLLKGDVLITLNGKPSYEYKLSHIVSLFRERRNKKITIIISRAGEIKKFKFRLENRI